MAQIQSIGFLEVMGYSIAMIAMDAACKCAEIEILGVDTINPKDTSVPIPVTIQVKFGGDVSDVKAAAERAFEAASRFLAPEDIVTHVIERPMEGVGKLARISKVKIAAGTTGGQAN